MSATHQFFNHLQSRFGGLHKFLEKKEISQLVLHRTDGQINPDDLKRLMTHDVCVLHVENFYPKDHAIRLGKSLASEATHEGKAKNWKISTSRGLESSDVATLGKFAPLNIVSGLVSQKNEQSEKDEVMNEYFEGVREEFRDRRVEKISESNNDVDDSSVGRPQLWPLDKLRLELDESWSAGAGLAREQNTENSGSNNSYRRPYGGGLPRVMMGPTRWKKGFIHVDEMAPLSKDNGLFSANIYLQMPESKGDFNGGFQIWPLGIYSRWDWYKNAVDLSGMYYFLFLFIHLLYFHNFMNN